MNLSDKNATIKANISKNTTLNLTKNSTSLTHVNASKNGTANSTINSSKLATANHTSNMTTTEKVWIQPANSMEKKAPSHAKHHNLVAKIRDFTVKDQKQE